MAAPQDAKQGFKLDAESLVRTWSLFHNRTVLYSFDHPAIQETIPRLYGVFRKMLEGRKSLSILFQETGYFIENIDLVYQDNTRKIGDHLRKFGIESLTFPSNLTVEMFSHFLDAASLTHANSDSFAKYLRSKGADSIAVNTVSLQTVREGESVHEAGSTSQQGNSTDWAPITQEKSPKSDDPIQDLITRTLLGRVTAKELTANLSLIQMLEAPQALPQAMVDASARAGEGDQGAVLKQCLMNVVGAFRTSAQSENASIEDLLLGMYNMRGELLKAVNAQREMANFLETDGKSIDSTEDIFDQTAAQLIVAEYQKTGGNLKRLAQIVQRVIPEKRQMQRVLPKVRAELLRLGIPLTNYYRFMIELNNAIGADRFYEEFLEAAEGMGVAQDELLSELKSNPRQAAQLILLASEVKRINKDTGGEQFIQALTDYVEKAGDGAVQDIGNDPHGYSKLTSMLSQMEDQINQDLQVREMPEQLRVMGQQKLRMRVQRSIADIKGRAVLAQLRNPSVKEEEKVHFLLEVLGDEQEMDEVIGSLKDSLDKDELARDIATQVLAKVRQELEAKKHKALSRELPAGIYVKAVLDFFIRFEINRALRYELPFSAMLLSFQGLPEDKESQEKHGESLRGLQNILAEDLRKNLRQADFIGFLSFNRFLIVLPMTKASDAEKIKVKLQEKLSRQIAMPDGTRSWVRIRCGLVGFDKEKTDTYQKMYSSLAKSWQSDR